MDNYHNEWKAKHPEFWWEIMNGCTSLARLELSEDAQPVSIDKAEEFMDKHEDSILKYCTKYSEVICKYKSHNDIRTAAFQRTKYLAKLEKDPSLIWAPGGGEVS